jgi:hypothetical protein
MRRAEISSRFSLRTVLANHSDLAPPVQRSKTVGLLPPVAGMVSQNCEFAYVASAE